MAASWRGTLYKKTLLALGIGACKPAHRAGAAPGGFFPEGKEAPLYHA